MEQRTRIPRSIDAFVIFMNNTDDYQKAIDPKTGLARYLNWGWTDDESLEWTGFRENADTYYGQYSNKDQRNTDVTNNLYEVIDEVVAYDQEHHLLDKISITPLSPALLSDYETFHVKKGTPLASTSRTVKLPLPGIGAPILTIKKTSHLLHQLHVTNPDKPKSVAKPKGIKEIQVYRATTALNATAPADSDYEYIGDIKRGSYISNFESTHVGMMAYYKVRYKSTTGVLGPFSIVIFVLVG